MSKILKFGIPKGSLENATVELFKKAGWQISISSRSYFPGVDDDEMNCKLIRPQEMGKYIQRGTIDAGNSVWLGATALGMGGGTIHAANSVGLTIAGSANLVDSNITADYGNIEIATGGNLDLTKGRCTNPECPHSRAGSCKKRICEFKTNRGGLFVEGKRGRILVDEHMESGD